MRRLAGARKDAGDPMIRRSTLIAFEILVGLMVTIGFGLGFMAWRLSQGPVVLPGMKQHIERQLSDARGGRPVTIERVELAWSGADRGLELKARGVKVLSETRAVLTESRSVDIGLSLRSLAFARLAVDRAAFDGADVTVTLAADGSAGVAFGPPGTPPDFVIPPPPPGESLAQRVNRILDGMASVFRPVGVGGALQAVRIDRTRLTIVDEKHESLWRADSAAIDLKRDGSELVLAASADFRSAKGSAPATLKVTTKTDFSAARVELTAREVQPTALIPAAALGPMAGLQAPVTAAITVGLDRKIGVTLIEGDVRVGAGALAMGEGRMAISGARLRGAYDLAGDTLLIDNIAVDGERTQIKGRIAIRQASAFLGAGASEPARFDVALPSVELDAPGVFSAPIAMRAVTLRGAIAPKDASITFDEIDATVENARVALAGRLYWIADAEGVLRPGLSARGGVTGVIDARSVLRFWPVQFVKSARTWVDEGVLGGRVSNAVFAADISPAELSAKLLRNESLSLSFDFDGANVRYLEGMTAITDGRGSAVLKGNRFDLTMASGRVGTLALSQGRVELPRLNPKGAEATFAGRAQGEARAMVDLLRQAPIGLDEKLPADPATIVGRGAADFAIRRPMLSNVPGEQVKFTVDAQLEGVGAVSRDGRFTIANWRMHTTGDERALTFAGPMSINRSQANLTWTESLRETTAPPSRFVIDGRFEAPDLIRFGFGVAEYATGVVGAQLTGTGRGLDVATASVRLDLKDAEIVLPKYIWSKRPGRAATASFDVREAPDGGLILSNLDARGPGVAATGGLTVSKSNQLSTLNLTRVWIDGRTDMRVTARRSREGVLLVQANGPMFDATPFLGPDPPPRPHSSAANGVVIAPERVDYAVQTDRVLLKAGSELANGRVESTLVGATMTRLDVRGLGPNNSLMQLSMGGPDGAATGPIAFRADDMGFAYRAITGADNVRGGKMAGSGVWRAANGRAEMTIKGENFQVVGAPAMGRLLSSIGSLRGLGETLNGEGISFNGLEAPLTIVDGKVYVAESRAAGPSLGITAKGSIRLEDGLVDLDGVVVPIYGLNSVLGGVPVLGQLFTSRRGEGMFAMTYSMSGPSDVPRVTVNPISALAPGILRRIFEPWGTPVQPPPDVQASKSG
ncbi:MAG: hypothetical protein JNM47_07130 [Hyphomonadaceae bacterium]|nr:hypothetical protein [Hyphomonadaceae bacterium]